MRNLGLEQGLTPRRPHLLPHVEKAVRGPCRYLSGGHQIRTCEPFKGCGGVLVAPGLLRAALP